MGRASGNQYPPVSSYPPNYNQGGNINAPPLPPPAYQQNAYQQNAYQQQGAVPVAAVVYIKGDSPSAKNPCQYCNQIAQIIPRKKKGCAVWGWCLALCFCTGLCCWIPFVVDSYYDI